MLGLRLSGAQTSDWRLEPERLVGARRWALTARAGDGEVVAHLDRAGGAGPTVVQRPDGELLGGSAGGFDVVGDAPAPDGRLIVAGEPGCPPELCGVVLAALLAVVILEAPIRLDVAGPAGPRRR